MAPESKLVMGRIVSLEGRQVVQVPISPEPTAKAVLDAARAYRDKPDPETEATLLQAARRLRT